MQELLLGLGTVCLYYVVLAAVAISLRFLVKIPDELFRKLLHFILIGSFPVYLFAIDTWWISALSALVFALAVFPILLCLERLKTYSKFVTERKKGELKTSLLIVFFMFAVVISVSVGWLGDKYIALAAVLAWGIGDAFAALIGKRFGKRKIKLKYTDGKKSYEGTLAMIICAFVSVLTVLLCRGGISPIGCIVTALVTALTAAAVELYSKNGLDTIFCPLSSMGVLIPLVYLFGGSL